MVCLSRPYPFKLLNVLFNKFYLVHSWILCLIYRVCPNHGRNCFKHRIFRHQNKKKTRKLLSTHWSFMTQVRSSKKATNLWTSIKLPEVVSIFSVIFREFVKEDLFKLLFSIQLKLQIRKLSGSKCFVEPNWFCFLNSLLIVQSFAFLSFKLKSYPCFCFVFYIFDKNKLYRVPEEITYFTIFIHFFPVDFV